MPAATPDYTSLIRAHPTLLSGDPAGGDKLVEDCRKLYRSVAERMDNALLWAQKAEPAEAERIIDALRAEEETMDKAFAPVAREIRRSIKGLRARSPSERAALADPLEIFLSHAAMTLELLRDTRWDLHAMTTRNRRREVVATANTPEDLDAIFDAIR